MDTAYQNPALGQDENVINILVFQQDDNSIPMLEQTLISDDTQITDSPRALTVAASPALSDGTSRGSLSSSHSQDELPSYSWFKRAPQANSTPRPSLYKSQSFTVGQHEVGLQYPDLADLRTMSGFNNSPPKLDRNILYNQMETNSECTPSQLSLKADTKLLIHQDNKRLKHKSFSIPVSCTGVDALSPDLFVNSLRQSTISSLTATPDSGFFSPVSSITEESLSAASPAFSTPKRFKSGRTSERVDVESPTAVNEMLVEETTNVDHEDESVLDRSLNSEKWLETFIVGTPLRPNVSAFNQTTKPAAKASCRTLARVVKSEPQVNTGVLTVTLPSVSPLISINSVVSVSQQALSSSLPQLRITPKRTMSTSLPQLTITPKRTMSTPLPQLTITPKRTMSTPVPQLSITPKRTMSTPLPQLTITPKRTVSTPLPQLTITPKGTMSTPLPQLTITPKQTISTPVPQLCITPKRTMSTPVPQLSITQKWAVSSRLPQLSITPKQTMPQLSMTPNQAMPSPLPQLSMTPMSTLPYDLQGRRVLQELNGNSCYNPVTRTQPTEMEYERPRHSFMDLIKMALKGSENGQLTLKEILAYIEDHFPYFKHKAKQSWKSSVRCNLSLHQDFTKVDDKKRGGKWKVAEGARSYMHKLPKSPVSKQAAASKVPPVTRLMSSRSGLLPILPKSVPYALIPLNLTSLEQSNTSQNIHDQAVQILQQQHRPAVLQPLQVQQIFHNQQPQPQVITSQQPLALASSTNSHRTKSSFQQIAPKLNVSPATLVWDSKSFVVPGCKNDGQAGNVRVECRAVSQRSVVPRPGDIVASSSNVTLDIGKPGVVSRPCSTNHILQPVGVQIQPGSLSNEKKIVFILKQPQEPEKQVNKMSTSKPADSSSHCFSKDNEPLQNKMPAVSLKARSICKSVDKFQRSKSDVGNRSTSVRTVYKGKSKDISKMAPVVNLEHLLKGEKQGKGTAKILLMNYDDDDDCSSDLSVQLPPRLCHSSKKSAAPRPESAPAKCLIQQAWDQASHLSESDVRDCHLPGSHSSGLHENSYQPVNATDIDPAAFSRLALPNKIAVSTASGNQHNIYYVACNDFPTLAKGVDHSVIQTAASCHNTNNIQHVNTNDIQHFSKEYRDVASRNENIKDKEVFSRCKVISENVSNKSIQSIHKDKRGKFQTDVSNRECQTKENEIPIPVIADKTVSARKIIFHSVPNSGRSFNSLLSTSGKTSSSEDSQCLQKSAAQATTNHSPCVALNRTKSRRKQIHTPLSTGSSPDKDTAPLDSTTNIDEHLKAGSNVGVAETGGDRENVHVCITPPGGTQHRSRATSSPNSDNPSPLDFAAFLSTLSTSRQLSLYVDSAVPSVRQEAAEFITDQLLSTAPPSKSIVCVNLPSSSSTTSSRIPVSLSPTSGVAETQGNAVVESPEMNLSPVSSVVTSISSMPGISTSNPHFLHRGLSLGSTTSTVPNADLNDSLSLMPSGHFDNFLYLATPPVGSRPVPTNSSSAYGIHLPQENQLGPSNSSGLLDSSLFDTLDSFMQNVYEFKTP